MVRRLLKVLFRVLFAWVLITLIASAGALVFLDTQRGHDLLRNQALLLLADTLPGLSVQAIEGSIYEDFVLRGVVLRDRFGGQAVSADRVRVKYLLRALLDRHVDAAEVEIDNPFVRIYLGEDGVNFAHLVPPSPLQVDAGQPFHFPLVISVKAATIRHATVTIEQPDGELLRFTNTFLSFSGRFSDEGLSAVISDLQSEASGLTQNMHVSLQGEADYLHALRGDLTLRLSRKDYPTVALHLLAQGPFEQVFAELALTLDTQERLHALGQFNTFDLTQGYAALLRIRNLDANDVLGFLPHVNVSADGLINEHAIVGNIRVTSANAGLALHGHKLRWTGDLDAHIDTTDPKRKLDLTLAGATLSFDQFTANQVTLEAHAGARSVSVKGELTPEGGAPVRLAATLPLELSATPQLHDMAPWNIAIAAPRFPLSWVQGLLKAEIPKGAVDVSLVLDGTLANAKAHATLKTRGATYKGFGKLDLNITLDAAVAKTMTANAEIVFRGHKLLLANGELLASGQELFRGASPLKLPFTAHAQVLATELTRYGDLVEALQASTGTLSAKINARGTFDQPEANADVHLRNATYAGLSLGVIDVYGDYTPLDCECRCKHRASHAAHLRLAPPWIPGVSCAPLQTSPRSTLHLSRASSRACAA